MEKAWARCLQHGAAVANRVDNKHPLDTPDNQESHVLMTAEKNECMQAHPHPLAMFCTRNQPPPPAPDPSFYAVDV